MKQSLRERLCLTEFYDSLHYIINFRLSVIGDRDEKGRCE